MIFIDSINKNDTVAQIARCSFDVHVLDIMGTLMFGGTVIMLCPGGILDLDYLTSILKKKQITYMQAVPSLLQTLFVFLKETHRSSNVAYLRSLCSSGKRQRNETHFSHILFCFIGEPCSVKLIKLLASCVVETCNIWNFYGPAETIICTYYHIDRVVDMETVSIGLSMPNYQCLVLDECSHSIPIGQEGELYVGGVGVFAGYLERDDLTEKVLIEIDGELFYRTGDLVRMDNNGLLHYQGRKDHQIKLHGQRIELGEIERCLLDLSISACVVVKWNDDHLVAYVQSSDMNEKQLREHCQSHLPPHMTPSIFMMLEKLPLNANGKIDRKSLPPPTFSHLSSLYLGDNVNLLAPMNETQVIIHHIWCDIFQQNQISIDTNLFTIGGHSLLLMKLFHRYKIQFHLQTNTLSIADLFQHPTIIGHAELIHQTLDNTQNIDNFAWSSLNLIQGKRNNLL
jgi:acyl-coenzyme A synthetase/AMP-(fatty) acid ligase/aryl carrier-like protein